ncbi:MAG: alpha-glucuronidase family glycosyl hydrolase [Pirellulaceae bacterium]
MKTLSLAPLVVLMFGVLTLNGPKPVAAEEAQVSDGQPPQAIAVVIAQDAGGLEQFAAAELQRYLQQLFAVSVTVGPAPYDSAASVFLLGTPSQLPMPLASPGLGETPLPQLSDQGFLLRKTTCANKPAMAIVGGSPAAMLWGVYELVERYGVTYLLNGDVYPEPRQAFFLPEINQVCEPAFKARWFKTMGDFAMGMEGWGMADYRPFLDQLAKLKFNRIRIGGCASAPFLDLQLKGVKRQSAVLWYGEHYPITPDMPGRKLFGDETEFWNPDLLTPQTPCEQLVAAGQRHMHALIAYARSRGIEASAVWSLTDFSKDFRSVIPDAQTVNQLGQLTVSPGPAARPDHPDLTEIGGTVIRTIVNEYPEAHSHGFPVGTESPSWVDAYAWAWQELDKQYGIEKILPLQEVLQRASQRADHWDGGAARSVMEVKGHITGLYFLLQLWNSPDVLPKSRRPDARLVVYEVAEELWPILPRIMPQNSEMVIVMDYNPTRVLRRRNVLATVPANEVPTTMILTLHDDSVGTLPQLTTGALHELIGDMRKYGISGFGTRQWLISDHDASTAYLAKSAWDPNTTPKSVYSDQVRAVCGQAAVEPMLEVFREIETVTSRLEDHGMGLTFPHAGMMTRQWAAESLPQPLAEDQEIYRRALEAIRKVPIPARTEGKDYVQYWTARLEFAVQYFDAIAAVKKGATAEKAAQDAKQNGDERAYQAKLADAIEYTKIASAAAFQAIDTYAAVAKNRADAGAVATMAEYVCRPLNRKIEELRAAHDLVH